MRRMMGWSYWMTLTRACHLVPYCHLSPVMLPRELACLRLSVSVVAADSTTRAPCRCIVAPLRGLPEARAAQGLQRDEVCWDDGPTGTDFRGRRLALLRPVNSGVCVLAILPRRLCRDARIQTDGNVVRGME